MGTREHRIRKIVFLAKRLSKQIWRMVENQVGLEGGSALQWSVLSGIVSGQGGSVSELSQAVDHDPGALSRSVNQLVEKGFLSYVPRTNDRRRVGLQLTRDGEKLFESLQEGVLDATRAIRASLTEDEFCQPEALLAKANAAIENLSSISG